MYKVWDGEASFPPSGLWGKAFKSIYSKAYKNYPQVLNQKLDFSLVRTDLEDNRESRVLIKTPGFCLAKVMEIQI